MDHRVFDIKQKIRDIDSQIANIKQIARVQAKVHNAANYKISDPLGRFDGQAMTKNKATPIHY